MILQQALRIANQYIETSYLTFNHNLNPNPNLMTLQQALWAAYQYIEA